MFSYRFGEAMLIEKTIAQVAAPGAQPKPQATANSQDSPQEPPAHDENAPQMGNVPAGKSRRKKNVKEKNWASPVGVLLSKLKAMGTKNDEALFEFAEQRVFLKNGLKEAEMPKSVGYHEFLDMMRDAGLELPTYEFKAASEKWWHFLPPRLRGYLALLVKVPPSLYQSQDVDLMKFLTWKEKKEDVVCRIVLIAVCQFLQVSLRDHKDKKTILTTLCSTHDVYQSDPKMWCLNMVVRVMICLAEYGTTIGIHKGAVPEVAYASAKEQVELDPFCMVVKKVLDPQTVYPADMVESKLGEHWWKQLQESVKGTSGTCGGKELSKAERERRQKNKEFAISTVSSTNYGFTGLPHRLRDRLPYNGPEALQHLTKLSKLVRKLQRRLKETRKAFLKKVRLGRENTARSYVEFGHVEFGWQEEVCLWHHILLHCGENFVATLGPFEEKPALDKGPKPKVDKSSTSTVAVVEDNKGESRVELIEPKTTSVALVAQPTKPLEKVSSMPSKKRVREEDAASTCKTENLSRKERKRVKRDLKLRQRQLQVQKQEVELQSTIASMKFDMNTVFPGYMGNQRIEEEITRQLLQLVAYERQIPAADSEFVKAALRRRVARIKATVVHLEELCIQTYHKPISNNSTGV